MYVVHGSDKPCDAASRHIVSNSKIVYISTKLVSVKEEQDTPLVEPDKKQQILRWVRDNLNLTWIQSQIYTKWKLCQAYKRRILYNSRYSEILGKFGVIKVHSNLLPECNLTATERFFYEAPVESHGCWQNNKYNS